MLVSRSYYEVMSCLSEDYAKLFHYEGSHTDKHVREHEVYTVGVPGPALRHPPHTESRGNGRRSCDRPLLPDRDADQG